MYSMLWLSQIQMNAYEIAHQLSEQTTNRQRKQFINKMVNNLASITGRTVEKQEIAIDERFGNTNFLLHSNDPSMNMPIIGLLHLDMPPFLKTQKGPK